MSEHALPTEVRDLLEAAADAEAADIHLAPGYPATFRVHGRLVDHGAEVQDPHDVARFVCAISPERLRPHMETLKSFDCSVAIEHNGRPHRYRANAFLAQGDWCACLRRIPNALPNLSWLGFPEGLADRLIDYTSGLVLVCGVTGSGKSSTLAAVIDRLRARGDSRVLTIEEPVEYVHPPDRGSMISQREVGRDTDSFADGLKYGLRQDPDVILVGEIRDRETARIALTAAETGHLIMSTMHTRDAKGGVSRLVDLFPQDSQEDIRKQLAMSLRTVIAQHLLPHATPGERRVLCLEVLHNNQASQVAIRSGKIESLDSVIQTGKRDGMIALDEDLQRLVTERVISSEIARRYAKDPGALVDSGRSW